MTTIIFSFVKTDKFYDCNLTLSDRYLNLFFQKGSHVQDNSKNFVSTDLLQAQ